MTGESLNAELEKIEKPAGISNPKDFRNEIVNFVLRARANNSGRNPNWTSYEKLRTVIEKKMFSNTEELLPVISFNAKTSTDDRKNMTTLSTHDGERLHPQTGSPAVRVVPAGS
ncbi:serine protein kinase PrkA [Klebsiella aerogenes]|nr:serine protein kinase PrkA [Klebsiella aerogenes]